MMYCCLEMMEYGKHKRDPCARLHNVRLTFTTVVATDQHTATYETANQPTEKSQFVRYSTAARVNSMIFDHTNGAATGYAERLNGSANEKYGIAKSISVMPGDVINAEVYAKYADPTTGNWNTALTTLMTQIAANTAGVVVIEGSSYASSTSSFPGYGSLQTKSDNGAPKAYLNWLVFDHDFNFLPAGSGYKQITTAGKEAGTDVAHEQLASPTITITQPGYVVSAREHNKSSHFPMSAIGLDEIYFLESAKGFLNSF